MKPKRYLTCTNYSCIIARVKDPDLFHRCTIYCPNYKVDINILNSLAPIQLTINFDSL